MNVISLKDYAKQNNVSYEAVRQQVVRYADELAEHIIRDGRQQFLDEDAVAFLDGKRQKNPVAIIQMDKDEQIEVLKQEKEDLLIKVALQADRIAELAEWKAKKAEAIAEAEGQKKLLEEHREEIAELKKQNASQKDENDVLSAENEDLRGKIAESEKNASEAVLEAQNAKEDFSRLKERNEMTESNLKKAQDRLQRIESRWWYKLFGGKE